MIFILKFQKLHGKEGIKSYTYKKEAKDTKVVDAFPNLWF